MEVEVAEGEDVLVENDMSGRDDAAGGDVVASVTAVVRKVANEHARRGAQREFVRGCGDHVGEAPAPEDSKCVVVGRHTEQHGIRRCGDSGSAWSTVDQVRGRRKSFSPERQWSCTVD